jgi:GMP synthase-like glutamine amidotransferase
MILVMNVCVDRLSELEFVRPIQGILKNDNSNFFVKHYSAITRNDVERAEKVIICGTALKDFEYLRNIGRFEWLGEFEKPVLGICAGFEILAKVCGNDLIERRKIGKFRVEVIETNKLTPSREFYSYFLNSKDVKMKKHFLTLAKSEGLVCMAKHETKEIYGCLFHPEVLNPEIITNFCNCL